jgi:adenylate cyclase
MADGATARRWTGRVRLWSGCVLFTYLTLHLANHALGLVSVAAMEAGRWWFLALWRNPLGTLLLYTALLVHPLLALWSLYRRRTLRMPAWEAWQLCIGLSIPLLLASHVVGTRLAAVRYDAVDSYQTIVLALWHLRPELGLKQSVLLVLAWIHGCIGMHFWLRLRPWYPRARALLFAGAVLLPALALLGFAGAGREIAASIHTPADVARIRRETRRPEGAAADALKRAENGIYAGFAAALGATLLARSVRDRLERRRGAVRVGYPDGRRVMVPVGATILEASRSGGIPHVSVCGGRGRCSTCRVHVVAGLETIPPAGADEQRVLERVGAPPGVRLACQARPTGDVSVRPLLPALPRPSDALAVRPRWTSGVEQEVTILFADLRKFTTLAERRLPYDVVFFLNRYFEAVGQAIEQAGGVTNQFTGDGVMALFGVDAGTADGCRRAVAGARAMVRSVGALSAAMADELDEPLRIGVGIHTGAAVVGRMGYGPAVYLTAVGDTVHVASRFQDLTKEYQAQLVISEEVARRAGVDVSRFARHEVAVRNRREPIVIRVIDDVSTLPLGEA